MQVLRCGLLPKRILPQHLQLWGFTSIFHEVDYLGVVAAHQQPCPGPSSLHTSLFSFAKIYLFIDQLIHSFMSFTTGFDMKSGLHLHKTPSAVVYSN